MYSTAQLNLNIRARQSAAFQLPDNSNAIGTAGILSIGANSLTSVTIPRESFVIAARISGYALVDTAGVAQIGVAVSKATNLYLYQTNWLLLWMMAGDTNAPNQYHRIFDERIDFAENPLYVPPGTAISGYTNKQSGVTSFNSVVTIEWIQI